MTERIDMNKDYDHNQHSVYLLYYHLIMVVKYRRKVIRNEISDRGREIFEKIAPGYGITGAPAEVIREYIERQGQK